MANGRYNTNQGSANNRATAAQRAANPTEVAMMAIGNSNLGAIVGGNLGADGIVNLGKGFSKDRPLPQAQADFFDMNAEERALWRQKTINVKGYRNPTGGQEFATWKEATSGLAAYQKATNRNDLDIYTYMDRLAMTSPSGGGGGGAPAPPSKYVTTQVDITNPSEARSLVEDAVGTYLGRRPTDYEFSNFLSTIKEVDRKNPTKSTQKVKSTGAGGGTQRTNVKQEGGVDRRQIAKEYARSRYDFAETNVETTASQGFLKLINGGL